MKHSLPPLESLKAFEAAARRLSITLAADELCLTKGAVSYQIKRLEQHLGHALFKRTTRQILLTDAGQMFYQTTQKVFEDLSNQIRLLNQNHQHSLVIAVTSYVALRWLSPKLASFCAQNPDINVIIQHAINQLNGNQQGIDMSISWQECLDGLNSDTKIQLPMPMFAVASPRLIERYQLLAGGLDAPKNLGQAPFLSIPLLCEERDLDMWQLWCHGQPLANPRHMIEDANVRVQAAIDGQGIMLADALMQNEINNHSLVAVSTHQLTGYGYAISTHSSQAQVQLLMQWLQTYEHSF
jgi:DNA-binding transcriptional LysR family regulator